jgi:alkyl hydroperoxide reductase subunit AhpF
MKRYQLVVIGSGSAGREATLLAAGKGLRTAAIVNIATIALRSGISADRLREFGLTQPSATEALMSTLRKLG